MTILKVNVNSRKNFSPSQIKKHSDAMMELEYAVNTVEFRTGVITSKFNPKDTLGLTNTQIYQMIMTGSEVLTPDSDREIDISVELYSARGNVVGYTNPGTVWTWVNNNFFGWYSAADIAENAFHEWLHKIGFDHISASDSTSVPYLLGELIRTLVEYRQKGGMLTPLETMDLPPVVTVQTKRYVCKRLWWTLGFKKVCWYE